MGRLFARWHSIAIFSLWEQSSLVLIIIMNLHLDLNQLTIMLISRSWDI